VKARQRRPLRVIAAAFVALASYLLVQTGIVLAVGYHPKHSLLGIVWTAVTAAAMFVLAHGKDRTGKALGNPVLTTEARVTVIDGLLASAVLIGLALNAGIGWWWADPAAGLVIVYYAIREARPSTPNTEPAAASDSASAQRPGPVQAPSQWGQVALTRPHQPVHASAIQRAHSEVARAHPSGRPRISRHSSYPSQSGRRARQALTERYVPSAPPTFSERS
jgi:Cation efflux family